jgi:hypothetical protein
MSDNDLVGRVVRAMQHVDEAHGLGKWEDLSFGQQMLRIEYAQAAIVVLSTDKFLEGIISQAVENFYAEGSSRPNPLDGILKGEGDEQDPA